MLWPMYSSLPCHNRIEYVCIINRLCVDQTESKASVVNEDILHYYC